MIDEDRKTLWCGNLPEQATEELLYELFLQAGPLEKVRIPRGKNFAFITYCHEVSVPYAISLLRGVALYHKTLTLQSRGRMALLPPPIRCTGSEINLEFQSNVQQQFANMTENLKGDDLQAVHNPRHQENENLVMASLQGNWSHRHHPYDRRAKEKTHNDYRPNHNDHKGRNSYNWRDRRNHKRGNHNWRD